MAQNVTFEMLTFQRVKKQSHSYKILCFKIYVLLFKYLYYYIQYSRKNKHLKTDSTSEK